MLPDYSLPNALEMFNILLALESSQFLAK